MVKHIVMFKLIEKNKANIDKAVSALKSLKENIEVVRSIEIGVNFTESERSYDIVLIVEFSNKEDLSTYGPHPNHVPVIDTIRSLCSDSVVVDYEFNPLNHK